MLVASPLLELATFYDRPFRMKAEAVIEIAIDDGEETLRGRIDILILQNQLWVIVLESKKTRISMRSALPQALAYMMANPDLDKPRFGMLTNGDDVLFVVGHPPKSQPKNTASKLTESATQLTQQLFLSLHLEQSIQ